MSDDQLARLRQLLDQSETLETEAEILQWCAEFDRLIGQLPGLTQPREWAEQGKLDIGY